MLNYILKVYKHPKRPQYIKIWIYNIHVFSKSILKIFKIYIIHVLLYSKMRRNYIIRFTVDVFVY